MVKIHFRSNLLEVRDNMHGMNTDSDVHFAHPFPKFYRGKKGRNLASIFNHSPQSRLLRPVFERKQYIRNLKMFGSADDWPITSPNLMSFGLLVSKNKTGRYPPLKNQAGKTCKIIINSAGDCFILLQFCGLMH